MHLKLNSPSPTIEKTTTTEITFTFEIVMSLVLIFKWIAQILIIYWDNHRFMFIFIYSMYHNFKTNWLKSDPHIHLNRYLYKVYVARADLLIWFLIILILKVRNTLKFKRIAWNVIILSMIFQPKKYFPHWLRFYFFIVLIPFDQTFNNILLECLLTKLFVFYYYPQLKPLMKCIKS